MPNSLSHENDAVSSLDGVELEAPPNLSRFVEQIR